MCSLTSRYLKYYSQYKGMGYFLELGLNRKNNLSTPFNICNVTDAGISLVHRLK